MRDRLIKTISVLAALALLFAAGCAKKTEVATVETASPEAAQTAYCTDALQATPGPAAESTAPPHANTSGSGLIVVGDSRCCQLGSYQQETGRNDFAVFAAWGGHYIEGRRPQILTDPVLGEIEACFRSQIETFGGCVIWFFATVNDYDYRDSVNSEGISAAVHAAERLASMSYEFGGEIHLPQVIVIGFAGCRDKGDMNGIPQSDFNRNVAGYNEALRAAVEKSALLGPYARYYTTVPEIVGSVGFDDDGLHYDDATLEAIIAYITGGADR